MTHYAGQFLTSEVDTTPGERGPFAPPAGFAGNGDEYVQLIRDRYRSNPAARQQIYIYSRGVTPAYLGPYAEQARAILTKIKQESPR